MEKHVAVPESAGLAVEPGDDDAVVGGVRPHEVELRVAVLGRRLRVRIVFENDAVDSFGDDFLHGCLMQRVDQREGRRRCRPSRADGKPERARSVFAAGTANVFVKDVERGLVV